MGAKILHLTQRIVFIQGNRLQACERQRGLNWHGWDSRYVCYEYKGYDPGHWRIVIGIRGIRYILTERHTDVVFFEPVSTASRSCSHGSSKALGMNSEPPWRNGWLNEVPTRVASATTAFKTFVNMIGDDGERLTPG